MSKREPDFWITRGGKHIPIFKDKLHKRTEPITHEYYYKKKTEAGKYKQKVDEHEDRVARANYELAKSDNDKTRKEKLNADRTLKEAHQRYSKRLQELETAKQSKKINSYSFKHNKVEHKEEVEFGKTQDLDTMDYEGEIYSDAKSGWTIEVKRRKKNHYTRNYSYYNYSYYTVYDKNGNVFKKYHSYFQEGDADVKEKVFNEAKDAVKRYNTPEPYKHILGPKKEVGDAIDKFNELYNHNAINPNWHADQTGNEYYKWHKNCAICTSAAILQAWGYDVEAGPRDREEWRGWETILNLPNNTEKSKDNINLFNPMPSGPDAATKKLLKTVKGWGDNTYGELAVRWKHQNEPRSHSVLIVNEKGSIYIIDFQTCTKYTDIHKYLSRTVCTKDEVTRLDNATLKMGREEDLKKMFKKRGGN